MGFDLALWKKFFQTDNPETWSVLLSKFIICKSAIESFIPFSLNIHRDRCSQGHVESMSRVMMFKGIDRYMLLHQAHRFRCTDKSMRLPRTYHYDRAIAEGIGIRIRGGWVVMILETDERPKWRVKVLPDSKPSEYSTIQDLILLVP